MCIIFVSVMRFFNTWLISMLKMISCTLKIRNRGQLLITVCASTFLHIIDIFLNMWYVCVYNYHHFYFRLTTSLFATHIILLPHIFLKVSLSSPYLEITSTIPLLSFLTSKPYFTFLGCRTETSQ